MSDFEIAQAKLRELSPNGDDRELDRLRKKLGPEKARTIRLIAMAVIEATQPLLAELKALRERIEQLERDAR
jgi:hypothetical protein